MAATTTPKSGSWPSFSARIRARGYRTLFLADAVVLYGSMVAINTARFGFSWPTYPLSHYVIGFALATLIHLTVGYFGGLYEHEHRLAQRVWLPRVTWLTSLSVLLDAGAALVTGRYLMPRFNLAIFAVVASVGLTATRWISRRLVKRRIGLPRVLLVGGERDVLRGEEHVSHAPEATIAGHLDTTDGLLEAVERTGATDVLLLSPDGLESIYPEPLTALEQRGIGVLHRVGAKDTLLGLKEVREVAGMPVVPVRSHAMPRSSAHFKRLGELGFLIVVSPAVLVVLALTAIYVRIIAGPGIILRQVRIGRGGKPFTMVKFRTMVPDAEEGKGPQLSHSGDPRIIPAAAWLRKTRLDEVPQVWNIVRGEMSIVGPRPERPELTAEFEAAIPGYARRHEIPPGITGLAQVQGRYSTDPDFKLGHDLQYLVNWSFLLDMQILVRTVWVVIARRV